MRTRRRPFLHLEALERREVPASVVYNGSLTVSNPRGLLTLTQSGSSWVVNDAGSNNGMYNVTGGITINTGNQPGRVLVQFAAGKSLPTNLVINGGNSADSFSIQGAAG